METERLELIPAKIMFCEAETRGRVPLEACLGARVPASWPPPVFEPDDVARIRTQLEADPTIGSWTLHYVLARPGATLEGRRLVGVAGYTGPPTAEGRVAIGYAIASEHQRRGFATEAVDALVRAAFRDPRVVVVSATTYPTLEPSIGVLTKNGFVRAGSEAADGTITYERRRDVKKSRVG
jgi:RimJ/RimL family protein N-acetyltransferase